ncbi:MAG: protein kinase [Gemmatimonadota bacterium]
MTDTAADRLTSALADRYAIEGEIGSGGMATVYLAQDLKHDRKVAVKVLRPELAAVLGAERFLNEIKVTANLQHPHILPLFDSGAADGFLFYVMPFVEGETLRDRLGREKQLPVAEAVRITTEVANALDYAHRHDVIHRDIKPGNILLQDGQALVADFGIALAVRVAGGNRVTETGLSLGTPEYMSPEQATADRELDARSDVYSLGAVLYEMLTGEPPHTGSSVQAIISRVLTGSVEPVSRTRPSVPVQVEVAVQMALEKLAADRFQSAQEFARALTGAEPIPHGLLPSALTGSAGSEAVRKAPLRRLAVAGMVLLATGLAIGSILTRVWAPPGPSPEVTRFTVPLSGTGRTAFDVSPDGRTLVYGMNGMLYQRPLDQFESEPIEGTEGGGSPFFSPDGRSIGFTQSWAMKKVPLSGGPVVEITELPLGWLFGAHWDGSGKIVYSWVEGVRRVAEGGGEPEVITVLDSASEHGHQRPQLLDGGRLLLYSARGPSGLWEDSKIYLQDLETGEKQILLEGVTAARYVPTGHVLYFQADGTLLASPFDLERREVVGDPFAVESGIRVGMNETASFSVSDGGTAAFVKGSGWSHYLLVSVDREGNATQIGEPGTLYFVEISPQGDRAATLMVRPDNGDIYLLDLETGVFERLTFDLPLDESPVWSPDGARIAYASEWLNGVDRVQIKSADPAAQPEPLFVGHAHLHLTDWSPDGRWLAFNLFAADQRRDIYVVQVDSAENLVPVWNSSADERDGRFSPDGNWLAYSSDESGPEEVFLSPFPPTGGKVQVSTGGGTDPRWSTETGELFFWKQDSLMVTRVSGEGQSRVETPRALFSLSGKSQYDVAPDGQSFLVKLSNPDSWVSEIHVVRNWFEVLKEAGGG